MSQVTGWRRAWSTVRTPVALIEGLLGLGLVLFGAISLADWAFGRRGESLFPAAFLAVTWPLGATLMGAGLVTNRGGRGVIPAHVGVALVAVASLLVPIFLARCYCRQPNSGDRSRRQNSRHREFLPGWCFQRRDDGNRLIPGLNAMATAAEVGADLYGTWKAGCL